MRVLSEDDAAEEAAARGRRHSWCKATRVAPDADMGAWAGVAEHWN